MQNQLAPLHPTDIGLILSYKCQSACAHCIYNCNRNWKEWITRDDLQAALEIMVVWQHAFQVHITGGEPFLNFPLLLEAIEIAASLGIPRYLETNAGWAVHERLVEKRFRALHKTGLQAILISVSPFHAESIPLERSLMVIRRAKEVFGISSVFVYQSRWLDLIQAFGTETTIPLNSFVDTYGKANTGRMLWENYGLISGGRSGYNLGHLIPKHPAEFFNGLTCAYEVLYAQHSHFDLYGNLIPGFCGGLSLGDWHDLPFLLARYQREDFPTIIAILAEYGPYGLFEAAVLEYNYKPLQEGYSGKCHLCVDVRGHLSRTGDFPELRPKQFYEEI
jgi:hypothetical protein